MEGSDFFRSGLPVYVNRTAESFTLLEHTHDFVEISYVSEGAGYHYIGGETLQVRSGALFYIPVGVSHVFRPLDASPAHKLIIYNCIFPEALFDWAIEWEKGVLPPSAPSPISRLKSEKKWRRLQDPGREIDSLMRQMHTEFQGARTNKELLLVQSTVQLMLLVDRHIHELQQGGTSSPADHKHDSRTGPILDRILRRAEESTGLGALSRELGLSERHIQRLLKQGTGMTYTEYIHSRKIGKCLELLRFTDLRVSQIAEAAGFQDLKHFHAVFKRKTGMTPGEYRGGHERRNSGQP